jgi:Na+/H+ antiporter NhaC
MIDVENIKHNFVSFVPKMVLSIKLLLFFHHNKITLHNIRTEH